MNSFWVSVSYDANVVLNNCFTVDTREEAVARMVRYLELEFDLPNNANVKVNHH